MNKFFLIIISLLTLTCSPKIQDNDVLNDSVNSNKNNHTILKNGLFHKFKGNWINTSLFDSTLQKKQLQPWLLEFYGDLNLVIEDEDSIILRGNMDGGKLIFKIIDSISFSLPGISYSPIFTYSINNDLVTQKDYSGNKIIYRRVKKSDNLNIIANEKAFNSYFINSFFTNDYFNNTERANIVDIWNGFATSQPFSSDAIGFKGKDDTVIYYSWKFKGDILELYNTAIDYDELGSRYYYVKKLNRRIRKK